MWKCVSAVPIVIITKITKKQLEQRLYLLMYIRDVGFATYCNGVHYKYLIFSNLFLVYIR